LEGSPRVVFWVGLGPATRAVGHGHVSSCGGTSSLWVCFWGKRAWHQQRFSTWNTLFACISHTTPDIHTYIHTHTNESLGIGEIRLPQRKKKQTLVLRSDLQPLICCCKQLKQSLWIQKQNMLEKRKLAQHWLLSQRSEGLCYYCLCYDVQAMGDP
jgi:hypothetical protein